MAAEPVFILLPGGRTAGLPLPQEAIRRPTWWAKHDPGKAPASAEWLALALALGQLPGVRVELYGGGEEGLDGAPTEVSGIRLKTARGTTRLLPCAVLGDVPAEVADALSLPSAASIGVQLVEQAMAAPAEGIPPCPARVRQAAVQATWTGPMMVYRGGANEAEGWDVTRAHLAAWDAPMPGGKARWQLELNPDAFRGGPGGRGALWFNSASSDWPGFALVEVEQKGEYPPIPAAIAGNAGRAQLRGVSLVSASVQALRRMEEAGVIEIRKIHGLVTCPARPLPFKGLWEAIGAYKAVYQRVFSGLHPTTRHIGRITRAGEVDWSVKEPDSRRSHPEMAVTGWWSTAWRSATACALAPADAVCAAHVDSIYLNTSPHTYHPSEKRSSEIPLWDVADVFGKCGGMGEEPGQWRIKVLSAGDARFYAPGRYDVGAHQPRMGGREISHADPKVDNLFLSQRKWTEDPRKSKYAISAPLDAGERSWYYDFQFAGREYNGFHGDRT